MFNTGLQNEDELVKSLNHKKIKDLSGNLQNLIRFIFKEKTANVRLKCKLTDNYIKPDIVITCEKEDAYVSIKNARSSQLHTENIKSFILFLRSIGISTETQKTILYYHFGDGTLDGSGKARKNYHDVFNWLKDKIALANQELNDRFEIIEKVVDRVIFQGVDLTAMAAEYIYSGDIDYGIVISKRQMMTYLKKKTWSFYDNLHVGPILLRPHARYADRAIVSDDRRNHVCCYWPKFGEDVKYIDRHYNP